MTSDTVLWGLTCCPRSPVSPGEPLSPLSPGAPGTPGFPGDPRSPTLPGLPFNTTGGPQKQSPRLPETHK